MTIENLLKYDFLFEILDEGSFEGVGIKTLGSVGRAV